MSNTVVLVPNSARLPAEMEAETGSRYAAFIQLGGAPLYRHILSYYKCDGDRVRIVFLLVQDAPELDIAPRENIRIEILRLECSGSIGETLLAGITKISPGDAVIVHMADTLLDTDGLPFGDSMYAQSRNAQLNLGGWNGIRTVKNPF